MPLSPKRGDYRTYVAILRKLVGKMPIKQLLARAHDKGFSRWAAQRLQGHP